MLRHLPALTVVVPMLFAPLCVVLRRQAWLVAALATTATLVGALLMCLAASYGRVFDYAFGGWAPPLGIAYRIDRLNAPLVLLFAFVAAAVVLHARGARRAELRDCRADLFFALLLLCLSGLLGIVSTNDLFNIFVFLEVASLSGYALVALRPRGAAALAAFRYLIMGSIGSIFLLLGIGYLYMLTGTLNLDDLAARLPAIEAARTKLAAMAFISAGLAMKVALFPLHLWLPGVYANAPSPVAAFLSATSTKASLYLLVRLFIGVFGAALFADTLRLADVLVALSCVAVVAGALFAVRQTDIKRMMAYSSISQLGYITLGVGLATPAGVGAGLVHLLNHSLIKGGLFLALGCAAWSAGGCFLRQLRGLGRAAPWTGAAIVLGGLSLIGVPLTAGFPGKWLLVTAAIDAGAWPLVAVVLLGSALSAVYVWRVVEALYFAPAPADARRPPRGMSLAAWTLLGASVYFGVQPAPVVDMLMPAAFMLFETS